jgi:cytosine/adenosine deaminase-related metal-dependent hydrolase
MTSEWSLTARWVFPVDAPPLERGVVTIAGDRIAAVELHGTRAADYDLGNAAILPGLVNAHTHLDLSGARGRCSPTQEFTNWLLAVIGYRAGITLDQADADIRAGLEESVRYGTTLLGDIAVGGESWNAINDAPVRAIVYRELIGLPHARALRALSTARDWLKSHLPTATCRPGWSPHAPYSASEFIYLNAAEGYGRHQAAVATHLAETSAEEELLREHKGPFVPFLTQLGVWTPEELISSWRQAVDLCATANPLAIVHANYLPSDVRLPPGVTIVYCPRTHAAFGHPTHPFREFLARGVRVALGTDGLASNPDLDVLAEARFVHAKHPDVAGGVLLRMITLSGAEALGWADETGSLTPGKSADLIVLPLPNEESNDPYQLVLESTTAVRGVLFRGKWTCRPDEID